MPKNLACTKKIKTPNKLYTKVNNLTNCILFIISEYVSWGLRGPYTINPPLPQDFVFLKFIKIQFYWTIYWRYDWSYRKKARQKISEHNSCVVASWHQPTPTTYKANAGKGHTSLATSCHVLEVDNLGKKGKSLSKIGPW